MLEGIPPGLEGIPPMLGGIPPMLRGIPPMLGVKPYWGYTPKTNGKPL